MKGIATKNQATASNGMCGWFDTAIKDEQPVPKMREMTHNDPQFQSHPAQGCIGWLVNTNRHQVVHYRPDPAPENAGWVLIRTYHYNPPRPPEPLNHRRVPYEDAIQTWTMMLKSGWRPCRAPAR